jgi:hypothetical protein
VFDSVAPLPAIKELASIEYGSTSVYVWVVPVAVGVRPTQYNFLYNLISPILFYTKNPWNII